MLLDLTVAALASTYCVYVLVESALLAPLRPRLAHIPVVRQIAGCVYCAAFWCAAFVALLWLGGAWTWWFAWLCAIAQLNLLLTLLRYQLERL